MKPTQILHCTILMNVHCVCHLQRQCLLLQCVTYSVIVNCIGLQRQRVQCVCHFQCYRLLCVTYNHSFVI